MTTAELKYGLFKDIDSINDETALNTIKQMVKNFIATVPVHYVTVATEEQRTDEIGTDLIRLLDAFRTDEISQDDIDTECELVRQEMYEQGRQI